MEDDGEHHEGDSFVQLGESCASSLLSFLFSDSVIQFFNRLHEREENTKIFEKLHTRSSLLICY